MRSKLTRKILNNTPQSVKDKVKNYVKVLLSNSKPYDESRQGEA